MQRYQRRSVAVAGLALALVAGQGHPADAANSRTGSITKFSGVDEIVEACTTTTIYANMPAMSRTVTVGAGAASSVVVTFSAAASLFGEAFDTGFVRLRIGNSTVPPGDIPFIGQGQRGAQSFAWESAPLTPGNYTIRVQWRTDLGSSFCVDARSLTVLHK